MPFNNRPRDKYQMQQTLTDVSTPKYYVVQNGQDVVVESIAHNCTIVIDFLDDSSANLFLPDGETGMVITIFLLNNMNKATGALTAPPALAAATGEATVYNNTANDLYCIGPLVWINGRWYSYSFSHNAL